MEQNTLKPPITAVGTVVLTERDIVRMVATKYGVPVQQVWYEKRPNGGFVVLISTGVKASNES